MKLFLSNILSIGSHKKLLCYLLLLTTIFLESCDSYLETDIPSSFLDEETVFGSDNEALSAVVGLYLNLYLDNSFVSNRQTFVAGLMADELSMPSSSILQTSFGEFQNYQIQPDNQLVLQLWNGYYSLIYGANRIIKNLEDNGRITEPLRGQLLGEALFMRAFAHFYLVNYFGDVPLITTTDVDQTANAPRTSEAEVYEQIVADLKEAILLLPEDYVHANDEKTRVNKWAATALLARVALYTEDWEEAETLATSVIDNYTLADVSQVFLANNQEAIFQIDTAVNDDFGYAQEAQLLISFAPYIYLTGGTTNSFESSDTRLTNWVGDAFDLLGNPIHYSNKYKLQAGFEANAANQEYYNVLRLAEQYLIRAEARAQLNNVNGAANDINEIRNRANLGDYEGPMVKENLLFAIEKERQTELFCEWSHRWFDLKRTGRTDAVLGTSKPDTWTPGAVYLPIPQNALNTNPNLTN